jgi:SAM-dependent methyltransferase
MDHADHVALLRDGIGSPGTVADRDVSRTPMWADIGAGTGAFTLALADLLGPGATIVAVDRDAKALRTNAAAMARRFPDVALQTVVGDLEGRLSLPRLDGLVAANSLHFVQPDRQVAAISRLAEHVVPGGRFIVVEYDADRGNPWVPHPFSFRTWQRSAVEAGLTPPLLIGRVPSRFLGAIYAAMTSTPG